ncbi:MAG: pyridoxamine 5'-phosphate oxidase family protein [Gammaproteobacteria bacterium]|nr:pyridoxamine 5'-phosphate oxidase family protein [Gammaproteobacteria bacterium]
MQKINSIEMLEAIYHAPVGERSIWKQIDHVNELYRKFIEASPFLILATCGEMGVDCSPRGDPPGFVRVVSPDYIQIPDRKGNNRLDSMRNVIVNPDVGVIFLIPNVGETIRISGKAEILIDSELCNSFAINNKPASSVLSIKVDKVYYQCQKALVRSRLWDPKSYIERGDLPSAGQMAQYFSAQHGIEFDGQTYDEAYPEHMKQTIY